MNVGPPGTRPTLNPPWTQTDTNSTSSLHSSQVPKCVEKKTLLKSISLLLNVWCGGVRENYVSVSTKHPPWKLEGGLHAELVCFLQAFSCTGFCYVISATLKSTLNSKQTYLFVRPQVYISGTSMNHLKMYLYRYIRQRHWAIGIQNDGYPFLKGAHVLAHACARSVFRLFSYMTARRQRQYCKVGGPA